MQDSRKTLNVQAVTTNPGSCHFLAVVVRKAERKAGSKKKLSELKCAEWWYQWLSQALLIKAERSVVLMRFTRVPAWDHYE